MDKVKKLGSIVFCSLFIYVATGAPGCPSTVLAQEAYPNKAVQVVVSAPPGGSLDLVARVLAEKFREYLGQPFVIANKSPSALAWASIATAKPDGYTILANSAAAFGYQAQLNPSFKYGLDDFSPIAGIATYPHAFIVNKDVPAKNVKEFVAYAKTNPNLSYGTTGYASPGHLAIELVKLSTGIPMKNLEAIHYPGVAPSMIALVGNQIQLTLLPYSSVIAKQTESGAVRILSIYNLQRSKFLPEVATFIEQGFPDQHTSTYFGFWAPAKTPAPVLKKLEEAARRALDDKEVQGKIDRADQEISFLSSQELRKYAEEQRAKWGGVIKKLNLKQE
jgi:tripartite-type tricarboxylate transporter receptor subunit TctC